MIKSYKSLWCVLILLGFIITTGEASACSCAATSIDKRFENADYVFTAMIIAAKLEGLSRTTIDEKKRSDMSYSNIHRIRFEFDPLKNYKGSSSELGFLYTPREGTACGIEVIIGIIQTFFVKKGEIVGRCSGVLRDDDAYEFYEYVESKGLD